MDRKAAIVQFWALLAIVAMLGLWHPALWFAALPMFFFPNCACCGTICANCSADTPQSMQVSISGFANDQCSSCGSVDGTYTLPIGDQTACLLTGPTCLWSQVFSDILGCSWGQPFRILMRVNVSIGPTYSTQVVVTTCGTNCVANFDQQIFDVSHGGSKPDCAAFSALPLSYNAAASGLSCGAFGGNGCDGSGATVEATAL